MAKAHFTAIVATHRRLHVSCVRDGMFGLALVLQAQGQTAAANATVQRLTEILIDATALEQLPVVHGFEARLALLRQQPTVALRWLETADVSANSNTLFAFEHALLTKVKTWWVTGRQTAWQMPPGIWSCYAIAPKRLSISRVWWRSSRSRRSSKMPRGTAGPPSMP